MPFSPHRHFERKREIFFVCGQERLRGKRGTGNMLHATWGVRCFMQTALRRKTETGNEKDPSAALGMTKRERHIPHSFSFRYGSQPPALRGTSFQRKEGEWRLPYIKAFSPQRHFERMREIFFVRGQEKDVRMAGNGKHHVSCDWGARRENIAYPIAKRFPCMGKGERLEKRGGGRRGAVSISHSQIFIYP